MSSKRAAMELGGWFRRARREYPRRKKAAFARVVRWEWASRADRSPQPFYFERQGIPRGRRLRGEPKRFKKDVGYGLDAQGDVAVERVFVGMTSDGRPWFQEVFYERHESSLERIHYHPIPREKVVGVVEVARATFEGDRIVSWAAGTDAEASYEEYSYEDGRIVRIDRTSGQRRRGKKTTDDHETLQVRWGRGKVVQIRERGSVGSRTLYKRPENGEPFAKLAADVLERLVELIPRRVAAVKLKERAYCLTIAYDGEGNGMFPPSLALGRAVERDDWAESADGRSAQGRSVLVRLAAILQPKLRRSLPVTRDFVVYAVDLELTTRRGSLRRAAGARTFNKWVRLGWLGEWAG